MKWVYLTLIVVLAVVFLRGDARLFDLVWNANVLWSAGAAVFLVGLLIGQWMSGYKPAATTARWAFWGTLTVMLLALVEYSVEWRYRTLIAHGETVVLSAASVEEVTQHYINAEDGLFRAEISVNDHGAVALVDTGASLVLLDYPTARAAGVDMDALVFDQPVTTASGTLKIARVMLDRVTVGKITLTDVTAAVSPQGQTHANLLGASFLSRLDAVTFKGSTAVLEQKR
ncbi:MAG: TIGR02281 family clan AA aspartic protease [Pseudomonadota bacterium]